MFGANEWKRRAMASIGSRSPAPSGFTWAQTCPRRTPPLSYSGMSIPAARVTTIRMRASAFSSGDGSPDKASRIESLHASRFLTSAMFAR